MRETSTSRVSPVVHDCLTTRNASIAQLLSLAQYSDNQRVGRAPSPAPSPPSAPRSHSRAGGLGAGQGTRLTFGRDQNCHRIKRASIVIVNHYNYAVGSRSPRSEERRV